MSELITLTFLVPEQIQAGLNSGAYVLHGGNVVDAYTQQVVKWLETVSAADASQAAEGMTTLIASVPGILGATLSLTSMLMMAQKFAALERRLATIEMKIDAQNIGKLRSGFSLAADAEGLKAPERQHQLVVARGQLENGSQIFRDLFDNTKTQDVELNLPSLPYLEAYIAGQAAVLKTYMATGEFETAQRRALRLKVEVMEAQLHYLKAVMEVDLRWYHWLAMPVILPAYAVAGLFIGWDTPRSLTKEQYAAAAAHLNGIAEKIDAGKKAARDKGLALPPAIDYMDAVTSVVTGYGYECRTALARN